MLTIDCGTQSVRTMVFDRNGTIIAEKKINFKPYFSLRPGWAEQDPNLYWNSACEAVRFLTGKDPELRKNIKGIVVTTLRSTHVLLDKNGKVLRPSILWLDQRMTNFIPKLSLMEKITFSLISMKKTVEIIGKQTKANWIKENEPNIWKKVYKYMLVSGFFYYKLTGNFVDSVASQIGMIPFNYKKKSWETSSKSWRWRVFGVERKKLYDLVKPTGTVGYLTVEASKQLLLPKGIPVIAGGSDKGCETIGNGCINPEIASLSFGTTATIQTTTKKYIEPIRFLPSYPALLPDSYNPEIEIFRGYWMLKWFEQQFAFKESQEAKKLGMTVEELLNEKIKDIPPASEGLILQPYWCPHIKTPQARGSIIGFTDVHTKYHIYKAIIEGINYALMEGFEKIKIKTKTPIKYVVVGGGGSQSDEICQITADMFGITVKRVHTHEVSSLGAAISGFVGLGIYKDFDSAIGSMISYEKVFKPNSSNNLVYKRLYNKVYKRLYSKLKNFYDFMYVST